MRFLSIFLAVVGLAMPSLAADPGSGRPAGVASRVVPGAEGKPLALKAPKGGALALVFYSTECPISNEASPELNSVARGVPGEKLAMVGLCVDPDKDASALAAHAKEFTLAFPVASDRELSVAHRLGVKVTPEVVVLDDSDRVRYRGRIDDRYAARGKPNANPRTHELRDAVAAVIAGKAPENAEVEAVGCPLPTPPKAEKAVPTYSGRIAAILKDRCVECHRPGQVGPFPLLTYEQARKRATDLASVVESRQMPPWKPSPGFGPALKSEKTLPEADVAALVAWAENGAPPGDPIPPLAASEDTDEWALGRPDLIIQSSEPFPVPAAGADIYRCFVIPTNLPKDVYISAIEYQPGDRGVVHHVLSYVDMTGQGRKRDEADPGLGYSCFSGPGVEIHGDLGGWAPGNEPSFLPEGVGRSLPKGADVIVQVHYHPNGKPTTDRTRVGLHFSKKPVKQAMQWAAAANFGMVLPAGKDRIEIPARWTVPVDVEALAISPHMHLLGKDMTIVLTAPDGKQTPIIKIDDWDFLWQNTYYFKEPIKIAKGTTLDVIAHFDNSASNPRNPNKPPKEVKWGEATTDEMCIGFLALTKAGQDLTKPGEVDDLRQIIDKSYEAEREKYRRWREAEEKKARGEK